MKEILKATLSKHIQTEEIAKGDFVLMEEITECDSVLDEGNFEKGLTT